MTSVIKNFFFLFFPYKYFRRGVCGICYRKMLYKGILSAYSILQIVKQPEHYIYV